MNTWEPVTVSKLALRIMLQDRMLEISTLYMTRKLNKTDERTLVKLLAVEVSRHFHLQTRLRSPYHSLRESPAVAEIRHPLYKWYPVRFVD